MGMFFNSFFRHADVVKMANLAQIVNVIAPIFTNKQGLFLQPIYYPIAEYGKQRGNVALDALVDSPKLKATAGHPALGALDVSVTYNKQRGEVYVNVLNRSQSQDVAARVDNVEGKVGGPVAVWEMNQSDFKTTNTFGHDKNVAPKTRTFEPKVEKNGFSYTFPAHSLTILTLKVQA
jgi:alpha-N-arabinofuranosidase